MFLVLYHSNYGHTERYARWLAEDLEGDVRRIESVKLEDIAAYNSIIFGHSVYAGSYKYGKKIAEIIQAFPDKKYYFFGVNLADSSQIENKKTLTDNVTAAIGSENMDKIQLFFFRGGIDYPRLSFMHRSMMWMMDKMLKKKKDSEQTESDRALIQAYGKKIDFVDRRQIDPLIQAIQEEIHGNS